MKNPEETKFIKTIVILIILSHAFNDTYAIRPEREYIRTPDSLGLDYESLVVKTSDGYSINTWVYSANSLKDNGKVLILAYPDAGNMSYFVYHSTILSSQGYTVVTFDYRGFGKSSDFQIDKDSLYYKEFAIDLCAVAETVHQKFPHKQTGIWAKSMGTIVAVKALTSLEGKVDFMVAEGFISNTSLIVERIFEQKQKVVRLPENSKEYLKDIGDLSIPILVFAASNDKITTYEDALQIKRMVQGKCEVIRFEGDHLAGFNSGDGQWGEYYVDQINRFLHATFN